MSNKRVFVVVDGLDGVGKGVFLDTIVEEAKKEGKKVFDVHGFWKHNDFHPSPDEIINHYDAVLTSEPTFAGLGRYIREELILRNGRNYSPEVVASAYALDRQILYQQLLLPLLEAGLDVYQSRSFSTSIVYQRQTALDEGREFSVDEILALPGNAFCYRYPFDHLIIPTIDDVQEALRRTAARDKDDNCIFENIDFQLKIKEHYDSAEFKDVFTKVGTNLVYMDAGKSIDFSKQQARKFYRDNIKK